MQTFPLCSAPPKRYSNFLYNNLETRKDKNMENEPEEKFSLISVILQAVPIGLGLAVAITAQLGYLDVKSGFTMLGIGLTCLALHITLKNR